MLLTFRFDLSKELFDKTGRGYVILPQLLETSNAAAIRQQLETGAEERVPVFGDFRSAPHSGRSTYPSITMLPDDHRRLRNLLCRYSLLTARHRLDAGTPLASPPGQPSQPAHTDFSPTYKTLCEAVAMDAVDVDLRSTSKWYEEGGFTQGIAPFSVIVAVTRRVVVLQPANKKRVQFEAVTLEPGQVLCFRGDVIHAGTGMYPYFSWAWFHYVDLDGVFRPPDATTKILLTTRQVVQQKLAELCAREPLFKLPTYRKYCDAFYGADPSVPRWAFDASELLCKFGGPLLPTLRPTSFFPAPRLSQCFRSNEDVALAEKQLARSPFCFVLYENHYWFAECSYQEGRRRPDVVIKYHSVPDDGACAMRSVVVAFEHMVDSWKESDADNEIELAAIDRVLQTTISPIDDAEVHRIAGELIRTYSPEASCVPVDVPGHPSSEDRVYSDGAGQVKFRVDLPRLAALPDVFDRGIAVQTSWMCYANAKLGDSHIFVTLRPVRHNEPVVVYNSTPASDSYYTACLKAMLCNEALLSWPNEGRLIGPSGPAASKFLMMHKGEVYATAKWYLYCLRTGTDLFQDSRGWSYFVVEAKAADTGFMRPLLANMVDRLDRSIFRRILSRHSIEHGSFLAVPCGGEGVSPFACSRRCDGEVVKINKKTLELTVHCSQAAPKVTSIAGVKLVHITIADNRTPVYVPVNRDQQRPQARYVGDPNAVYHTIDQVRELLSRRKVGPGYQMAADHTGAPKACSITAIGGDMTISDKPPPTLPPLMLHKFAWHEMPTVAEAPWLTASCGERAATDAIRRIVHKLADVESSALLSVKVAYDSDTTVIVTVDVDGKRRWEHAGQPVPTGAPATVTGFYALAPIVHFSNVCFGRVVRRVVPVAPPEVIQLEEFCWDQGVAKGINLQCQHVDSQILLVLIGRRLQNDRVRLPMLPTEIWATIARFLPTVPRLTCVRTGTLIRPTRKQQGKKRTITIPVADPLQGPIPRVWIAVSCHDSIELGGSKFQHVLLPGTLEHTLRYKANSVIKAAVLVSYGWTDVFMKENTCKDIIEARVLHARKVVVPNKISAWQSR